MHLHTLHIEHTVLLAVYAVLTVANTRLQRGMAGARYFELYSVLALFGAGAVMLRGSIPDFLSVTAGNICVLAAYAALHGSMAKLFHLRRRQTTLLFLWLLLASLCMVWWGSVRPDTPTRLFAYSLFLGGEQLYLGVLLLSGSRERQRLSWMLAVFLLALAAVNLVRLGAVLFGHVPQNYLQSGSVLSAVVLANTSLQCGVMVAYVWMTAALLRGDLERRASTDPLTGLLNRRALEIAAEHAVQAINRGNGVFATVVMDLDGYKKLNDRLGHAAGDQALQAVSQCVQNQLRDTDFLARSGGDEFVLLLPRATGQEATEIAERLRGCVEALDLELSDPSAGITASFGVAEAVPGETWVQLLARCDGALYAAKHHGGNSVFLRAPEAQLTLQ